MINTIVTHLFERAGLRTGSSDSNDVIIHDDQFFREVLLKGSIGLGNSYVNGAWDAHSVDLVVFRLLKSGIYSPTLSQAYDFVGSVTRRIQNLQNRTGSYKVIDEHYDLDSKVFLAFLDRYNQYTCGYFEGTDDLDQAQENKLELICNKLNLRDGDRILDIGGGWGGLALYMTEKFDVNVSLVTLSRQQANHAQKLCENRKVKIHVCDYRDIPLLFSSGCFDKITAVGVLEHIGHKNYKQFMKYVNYALKSEGRCLFQTLYSPTNRILSNPWIRKYIFPNHELPPKKMVQSVASKYFQPADRTAFQDLTPHYVKTLLTWNERLNRAVDNEVINLEPKELRKWNFYFLSCAGALRAEHMKVGQFVYSKP
jgi:cyclopropane-fatty-acyl-phospholipid synthase